MMTIVKVSNKNKQVSKKVVNVLEGHEFREECGCCPCVCIF
jgi:hypothetical protein